MNKKNLAYFFGSAALAFVAVGVYGVVHHTAKVLTGGSVSSGRPLPSSTDNVTQSGATVTKVGSVGCLTSNDTSGPQSAICAVGLKTDDGSWYALGSSDPTVMGGLPSGQRVSVIGTLSTPVTQYQSVGTITVRALARQ